MINRAALILKYREPATRWINEADPYNDDPGITLEDANEEATVYLIGDEDANEPAAVDRWIERNYKRLFESELDGWYADPDLWPRDRTMQLFRSWFDVECHTTIIDTVGGDIYEDEG